MGSPLEEVLLVLTDSLVVSGGPPFLVTVRFVEELENVAVLEYVFELSVGENCDDDILLLATRYSRYTTNDVLLLYSNG